MKGLEWLGPVNEIPYVNEVHFDYADGEESENREDVSDINVIEEYEDLSDKSLDKNSSDIYMNANREKTLFGFSYKKIAIALIIALVAYLVLKK